MSKQPDLQQVLHFMQLMLRLQDVLRVTRPKGRSHNENDVEHSYQLAMMAWYLNDSLALDLDVSKLLRYSLVHDLAEIYAGDVTPLDTAGRATKSSKEAEALERIAAELPEFPALVQVVRAYEDKTDPEGRLVYALDKLMPMLLTYLQDGAVWHELEWSRSELLKNKDKTTASDPVVAAIWTQLRQRLQDQPALFPKD